MALYKNTAPDAAIASVEFTPVSDGNFTFFEVSSPDKAAEVKKWVTSPDIGQEIVAETLVNGKPMLVTHGDKPKEDMLKSLEAHGDKLQLHVSKKPFNFWFWRGVLSMTGHPMQFVSGWTSKNGKDFSVVMFAVLNLTANLVNIVFGAQKSEDKNRLHLIKNQINDELGSHLTFDDGNTIPVDETRATARKDPPQPKSMGQKFHDFMQRNSVTLGEVGLRYLGGISLVAPLGRWKKGFNLAAEEKSIAKFFSHIKNPDQKTYRAGTFWLAGKTLAFFAKTPDPYKPGAKSSIEEFREKYLFQLSTVTEMMGSSYLAIDRFKNTKRRIILGGKEYQDYLGGIGGLLFSTAFAMRLSAPYGVKELNMEEVYAHAADTLAKTPPDKLPQLMADTASTLKENLKDKDVEFGQIYTKMMTDLYRYHHIALTNLGTEPEERVASMADNGMNNGKYAAANPSRKSQDIPAPAASFADKAVKSADGAAITLH